ncbi:MAG: hypothetical protein QG635_1874 [Bacteroidota bacterium]|nr:hypothetical protein [Bacteroidota bacterium]
MKNYYILGGILAVLIIIAVAAINESGEQSKSPEVSELLVKLDSVKINKIEIKNNFGETVTLVKESGGWFVNAPLHYPADKSRISHALGYLPKITVKMIASSNPGKQSIFGVASDGVRLKVYEGGSLKADMFVGKPGPDYSSSYLRLASSNDVVLGSVPLSYIINAPIKDWRDKTIIDIPSETLNDIYFQYDKEQFNLKSEFGIWKIDDSPADSNSVKSLTEALANFKTDFFCDSIPQNLNQTEAEIKFSGKELRFIPLEDDRYYVHTSDSPQWFIVLKGKIQQFLKKKEELTQKES